MTEQNISILLKQLRKTSSFSANDVVKQLKEYGIDISAKTLYGYESGLSMPNADIFIALCRIYKCENPLDIYGSSAINSKEANLLDKYRDLDDHGRELVDLVLDKEHDRCIAMEDRPAALRIYTYMRKIAAAGNGFYFDDIPTETIEAPYMEGADFIIGVSGDSMEPTYHDGDLLYVQKSHLVRTGEIGIFMINNECFVKEAGEDGLISHNRGKYDPIPGNESVQCVGRVLGKVDMDE